MSAIFLSAWPTISGRGAFATRSSLDILRKEILYFVSKKLWDKLDSNETVLLFQSRVKKYSKAVDTFYVCTNRRTDTWKNQTYQCGLCDLDGKRRQKYLTIQEHFWLMMTTSGV